MPRIELRPLPPEAAIAYFESKGFEFSPSFDWRERWQEDHAASFMVAKAMRADLLQDIHDAVSAALRDGKTFRQFRQELEPLLRKKGWWGRQTMVDPATGEERVVQLGSPWRLRTIFDVNLRMAQAAGVWARIQRTRKSHPYLRYVAILDRRTRQNHRNWHGTVRPADDPFWETHMPPNGWRCRCAVQQLSDRDLERRGLSVSEEPQITTRPWRNGRTGETHEVPTGIDAGFAYNPGRAALDRNAARIFGEKSLNWSPRIAAGATAAAARYLDRARGPEYRDWLEAAARPGHAAGRTRVIGALSAPLLDALEERGVTPASGAITIRDSEARHMMRPGKSRRGQAIPLEQLRRLPELLAAPKAILRDKRDGDLLYILDVGGALESKVVVRLDFAEGGQTDIGRRRGFRSASIRTAGQVDPSILQDTKSYEIVFGNL